MRKNLCDNTGDRAHARASFGLDTEKTTVLVVGGSLGARTLNESMEMGIRKLLESGLQIIWQTGKFSETGRNLPPKDFQEQ